MAQLVQLVGRDIEPIWCTTAFAGCIFQHDKLALALDGSPSAGRDFTLNQLNELPDTVSVVNDIISGVQRQRVDYPRSLGGKHSTRTPGSRDCLAIHFTLGENAEAAATEPKALADDALRDQHYSRGWLCSEGLIDAVCDVALTQNLCGALDQAVAGCDTDNGVSSAHPGGHKLPHFIGSRLGQGKWCHTGSKGVRLAAIQAVNRDPGPRSNRCAQFLMRQEIPGVHIDRC